MIFLKSSLMAILVAAGAVQLVHGMQQPNAQVAPDAYVVNAIIQANEEQDVLSDTEMDEQDDAVVASFVNAIVQATEQDDDMQDEE